MQSGFYALTDYDFKKPRTGLLVKSSVVRPHQHAGYEWFHYPGEYKEVGDGEQLARTRIEELQAQYEYCDGKGNARGLAIGTLFTLDGHPRQSLKREYLVVSAAYRLHLDEYLPSLQPSETEKIFECSFRVMDKTVPFRPPRITPRPTVRGPQTAVVVGPLGEEIYVDKYARVKVQFHWDRYGNKDENSSCWVRVSQPWAGKNWGMIAHPRIGQEVIVDFLEGDPDQPIITGRVYNNNQMPPYDLPANATQTGIKSRSSKGGGTANFNEVRFEDKIGQEQLYIHAEKNQDNIVEHDETTHVGRNRSETVGGNETITVHGFKAETVIMALAESVGLAKVETIGLGKGH